MNPFQKWLLWGSSIATAVTGVVYWWMKNMMNPVDAWAVINHPLQPWVLKAHIVVAPLLVFAVGVIAVDHIWKHYRTRVRIGRGSGITMMWILAPMIVSGYLIQAVTHAGWLTALVWVHVVTGVLYSVAVVWHHLVFRRRRRIRERLGGARWEAVGKMPTVGPAEDDPERPVGRRPAPAAQGLQRWRSEKALPTSMNSAERAGSLPGAAGTVAGGVHRRPLRRTVRRRHAITTTFAERRHGACRLGPRCAGHTSDR